MELLKKKKTMNRLENNKLNSKELITWTVAVDITVCIHIITVISHFVNISLFEL